MTNSRFTIHDSPQNSQSRVLVVAGATASGKTGLSIELAKRLNGAIISADSRMVYRGLDIGTGKPTWEHRVLRRSPWITPRSSGYGPVYQIDGIDHYALDVAEPGDRFTLTDWLELVRALIPDLIQRGYQPIVVGGTGLYLKALVHGFEPPPTDPVVRSGIESMTTDEIRSELLIRDPETVNREPHNRRRLIRALEVVRLTGRPISWGVNNPGVGSWTVLGVDRSREELYERIDQRVDERLSAGMAEEVQRLIQGATEGHERAERVEWLRSLGLEYRTITEWLAEFPLSSFHIPSGNDRVELLRERLKSDIHAYARRQLTYLRNQLPVSWVSDLNDALARLGQ